jgi:hypothetical protein
VCCSSGWPIAVEAEVERGLQREWPAEAFVEPPPKARVLALDELGRCRLLENGQVCRAQARLGHSALPLACRQFPRLTIREPRGVRLSLSHYCPTAASLLFRRDVPLEVDDAPPAFPADGEYVGLEVNGGWPPLLRPGVLMCFESLDAWERFAVSLCASPGARPGAVLAVLRSAAEDARRWTPDLGPFRGFLAEVTDRFARGEVGEAAPDAPTWEGALDAWREAAACVPSGLALGVRSLEALVPPSTAVLAAGEDVASAVLADHATVVCRYLAAKAFASWQPLLGLGLRSAVSFLALAIAVLRIEMARLCGGAVTRSAVTSEGSAQRLAEAIRRADLLLVHLVDPAALAERLGRCESVS